MLARESLDEKQLELYSRLELDMKILNNKIEYEFEDALDEDLLPLFTAINDEGYTLIGTFESVDITRFREVLNEVQKRGLLQDIVKAKILSSKNQDEVKSISLIEYITDPNRKSSLDFLHAIQGSCGLESFWKVISEDDRERIKTKLNEDEHKDVLDEINRIEEIKSEGVQIDNTADDNLSETSLASDESTINSKSNSANESESRKDAANKAIVAGAICGVIAGLAVGGGLFAAGVALPILALIGIAVAAALVTGLVAGGITYVISSKIENPDTSRLEKEQDLQPN
ncbi:sulfite exporter TauE/SafE family protein [Wolbachia endosymbiont (group B) of Xanthorhoe designata]|uniref:sulfite exporter TauE/SafE family protein n=1 Tax=Wolbachia endosymbiont (group B) of Xanthorhoe designata TaxID=3066184 RepID=UPI00333FCFC8